MMSNDSHDRLEIKSGGGCLIFFGLPFFCGGLAIIIAGDSELIKDAETGAGVPPMLGLVFAVVGGLITFGRAGKLIDRTAGTITTWWGLLVPMRSKTRPLDEFHEVTMRREVRRSNKNTRVVYPVRLRARQGADLTLEELQNEKQARRTAERVAKFLGLPLADTTHGTRIVRQADELDESLRERARRTGVQPEVPPKPPEARSSHRLEDDTLVLEIPPSGFTARLAFQLAIVVAAPMMIGSVFFGALMVGGVDDWTFFLWMVVMMLGVPLLAIGVPTINLARQRTVLKLTPQTLTVSCRGPFFGRTTAIPADELEELEIVPGHPSSNRGLFRQGSSILARSDHASVQFGEGLTLDELRWIRDLVHSVVTA